MMAGILQRHPPTAAAGIPALTWGIVRVHLLMPCIRIERGAGCLAEKSEARFSSSHLVAPSGPQLPPLFNEELNRIMYSAQH